MKNQLEGMSVTYRTLMIGLSAQDSNIKDIFSAGRAMLKRAWPAHPPAYVFAGDELGAEQGTMIKSVYPDDYDNHQEEIEKGAKIPAYGKPLLSALVLNVLGQKFATFIGLANAPLLPAPERKKVADGAMAIRDLIAALAGDSSDDRRNFIGGLVAGVARNLAMFRGDKLEKWQSSLKAGEDEGGYRLPSGDALLWLSRRRGYILNRASLNFDDHGPVVTQILSNAELDFVTALAHIMGFTGQTVDGIAIESGQDQKWLRALFGGEAAAIDLPALVHWPMPWGLPRPPSSDWP